MADAKHEPAITINITPGKATPSQRAAWNRFWQKLVTDCKSEALDDRKSSG